MRYRAGESASPRSPPEAATFGFFSCGIPSMSTRKCCRNEATAQTSRKPREAKLVNRFTRMILKPRDSFCASSHSVTTTVGFSPRQAYPQEEASQTTKQNLWPGPQTSYRVTFLDLCRNVACGQFSRPGNSRICFKQCTKHLPVPLLPIPGGSDTIRRSAAFLAESRRTETSPAQRESCWGRWHSAGRDRDDPRQN